MIILFCAKIAPDRKFTTSSPWRWPSPSGRKAVIGRYPVWCGIGASIIPKLVPSCFGLKIEYTFFIKHFVLVNTDMCQCKLWYSKVDCISRCDAIFNSWCISSLPTNVGSERFFQKLVNKNVKIVWYLMKLLNNVRKSVAYLLMDSSVIFLFQLFFLVFSYHYFLPF